MLDFSMFETYEGLIFDMDGTLINTMPSHKKAWDRVGIELGYPLDGNIMYELGGAPVGTIAMEMMKRSDMPMDLLEQVLKLKQQYGIELIMKHATLLPAFDVVKFFLNKKPMALGTGSHRNVVEMLLNKFELHHYFNAVVAAEDVKNHKPAPDTFLRCAKLCGLNPKNCIVFEDADLGVESALKAKMDVFDVRINKLITYRTR
ncbi:HAD superfamily hydrolase (TIGR01509 family)/beta-phosphoglucomutase family hydrolase [Bisgaardia hudsonensis]|uniref:HAD superfamily hydrolase (TIGR01509 family)/beta-phosphoglucomutase family hydrolase n=1 Tax=Bisgaardia hudsonensis TaxID=109472 RepID=A0A4R2MYL8_9PAST|nr:beta-phosphoglucomutase family hydrolase [Bisgaardia hudsonensis]QLB13809.1 hypothetical protein A6A11_09405 [Bisgaardia hudsonensis]TCP11708.1 HAD superfamily hydrolase (TIGR01509 family)/beta-phosphoglucomutase family hydrolase [Bisgaardia hudsonensis]